MKCIARLLDIRYAGSSNRCAFPAGTRKRYGDIDRSLFKARNEHYNYLANGSDYFPFDALERYYWFYDHNINRRHFVY